MLLQTEKEQSESDNRLLKGENEGLRTMIDSLEKAKIEAAATLLGEREQLQRAVMEKQSADRLCSQAQASTAALAAEVEAAQARLREAQNSAMELEIKVSAFEIEKRHDASLKERITTLVNQLEDHKDSVAALTADNARLQAAEKRVRVELSEAVNTVERLNSDMNELKLAHSLKLSGMARRIDEDVHFLMQERDQLQAELERFYGLPNPCGVGMVVEDGYASACSSAHAITERPRMP